MKQEILSLFPWPWLSTTALIIFFSFFVLLLLRVNMRSTQKVYKKMELLPLTDGERR